MEANNDGEVWPELIKKAVEKKKDKSEDKVREFCESVKGVTSWIGLYHDLRKGRGEDEEKEVEEEEGQKGQKQTGIIDSSASDSEEGQEGEEESSSEEEMEEEGEMGIQDVKTLVHKLKVGVKGLTRPQLRKAMTDKEARAFNGVFDLMSKCCRVKKGKEYLKKIIKLVNEGGQTESTNQEISGRAREEEEDDEGGGGVEESKRCEQGDGNEHGKKRKREGGNKHGDAFHTPEQGDGSRRKGGSKRGGSN